MVPVIYLNIILLMWNIKKKTLRYSTAAENTTENVDASIKKAINDSLVPGCIYAIPADDKSTGTPFGLLKLLKDVKLINNPPMIMVTQSHRGMNILVGSI